MGYLRFVVGEPGIRQSNSWKLENQGDEVYLLTRGMLSTVLKFSFHKSGKCRWAEIAKRSDGSDRCIHKWERGLIPSVGTGGGCRLVSIAFPANHLSAPSPLDGRKLHWIDPAPPGMATMVEVMLTAEDKNTTSGLLASGRERRLIYHKPLRSGQNVLVTSAVFDCGPVDVNMPGEPRKPGQVVFEDLAFPNQDVLGTGRPVRMAVMAGNEVPPTVWELGGYRAQGLAANQADEKVAPAARPSR